jgi:hypothetical protein
MLTQRKTSTIKLRTSPAPRVFGDELFPEQAASLGGLITCRVCDRVENVVIGHPALLCGACLVDLSATSAHVAGVYAAAIAFFFDANKALDEALRASPERAWWAKVEAAWRAEDFDSAAFTQAWERAKATGGEKARLCSLWEALDREAKRLEPMNAWYTAAERELRAARTAAGDPVEV